jgi:hypothetical protein
MVIFRLGLAPVSMSGHPASHLSVKSCSVTGDYTSGNPPLTAIAENLRADQLNGRQNHEKIGGSPHRSGHDCPAVCQFSVALELLVLPRGGVLNSPKGEADCRANAKAESAN